MPLEAHSTSVSRPSHCNSLSLELIQGSKVYSTAGGPYQNPTCTRSTLGWEEKKMKTSGMQHIYSYFRWLTGQKLTRGHQRGAWCSPCRTLFNSSSISAPRRTTGLDVQTPQLRRCGTQTGFAGSGFDSPIRTSSHRHIIKGLPLERASTLPRLSGRGHALIRANPLKCCAFFPPLSLWFPVMSISLYR